ELVTDLRALDAHFENVGEADFGRQVLHLVDDGHQREQIDVAGLGIIAGAQFLAGLFGVELLAGRLDDRLFDSRDDDVLIDILFAAKSVYGLGNRTGSGHSSFLGGAGSAGPEVGLISMRELYPAPGPRPGP